MRPMGRIRRTLLAVALTVPGLAALSAVPAVAAPASLISVASNRCLDVVGNSTTPGAAVAIWDCNGQANQQWDFASSGDLRTFGGTRCLDVENGSTTAGARLLIWECTGQPNQKFRLNANGSVTAVQSGLCLDVAGAATANGSPVNTWNCNGQTNQQWRAGTGPGPDPTCSVSPVNPNSNTAVRKVLCYLHSQYGNHILAGQEESTWNGGPEYEMNYVQRNTGKLPALRGMDQATTDYVGRAITWWNSGGIPEVAYHMGAPTKPDTYEGSQMAVSINAVLTSGTAENNSFRQRMDAAAANLQRLEDIGAAVIWRPFHEAGGTWFWWSKEGGGQYVRLWRYMYDYLTRTKGLNNLIWMFGTNGSPNSAFYPGKAYVDIGGADTYAGSGNYDPQNAMYNAARNAVGSQVPVALHENGPIPDPDRLQSTNTRWLWFMTWNSHFLTQHNSVAHLQKVYASSYVITRDELPNFR